MTLPTFPQNDTAVLRGALADHLAGKGVLDDPGWRAAVEAVPRHDFVPGFYLPAAERDEGGLTVWEPVTPDLDHSRWLSGAYSDITLVTQFDGVETDWRRPSVLHGGAPSSSSTLPSLVVRTWSDAEVTGEQTVLEIGTGTGYSTALACERLGSAHVTSVDVDARRLEAAASALNNCGYTPTLALADGLYGYWPEAWFDRIVATCSVRTVPRSLLRQVRPGGKLLLPLSGWLYGYARVLLTVAKDGSAEGPLLPGTISFMPARTHVAPAFGNPADWSAGLTEKPRTARYRPERITDPTEDAFHLRFLAQCAVPNAQWVTLDDVVHLIDIVSGSAATLTPRDGDWEVREGGPVKLWGCIERLLDDFDASGRPRPEAFRLRVDGTGQFLRHPGMPDLRLTWV